jgi:inosine-uridine nucleoside N-ribohydrolase
MMRKLMIPFLLGAVSLLPAAAQTALQTTTQSAPQSTPANPSSSSAPANATVVAAPPQKVILDTDIGDDIDDAYALALAVSSPQLQVLGITTDWGETTLRARLVKRFLDTTGHPDIPVAVGLRTQPTAGFTQEYYAEGYQARPGSWPNAVQFLQTEIKKYPGQITLIALAPFHNLAALITRDPATFKQLKRVVLMGGSIHQGYGDLGYLPGESPSAEYNIASDIPAAQKLFASGVPIDMMPLDSTQLKLDEVMRPILFSAGTPLTDTLDTLTNEWTAATQNPTPTLYDAMAVAYVIDPSLCPTQPMDIVIGNRGFTHVGTGAPNANVCLHSDADKFFHFLLPQLMGTAGEPILATPPGTAAPATNTPPVPSSSPATSN